MDKFWMVWNEAGSVPMHKHISVAGARIEAERLARIHPGATFHVLELRGSCVKYDVHWDTNAADDGLPF